MKEIEKMKKKIDEFIRVIVMKMKFIVTTTRACRVCRHIHCEIQRKNCLFDVNDMNKWTNKIEI